MPDFVFREAFVTHRVLTSIISTLLTPALAKGASGGADVTQPGSVSEEEPQPYRMEGAPTMTQLGTAVGKGCSSGSASQAERGGDIVPLRRHRSAVT